MCSTTDDRRDAGLNGGAPKHPKRRLIATIRERPITCDDCCHTIWYRVYNTATEIYEDLFDKSMRLLRHPDTIRELALFDDVLPDYKWMTPMKKLDFLLWANQGVI